MPLNERLAYLFRKTFGDHDGQEAASLLESQVATLDGGTSGTPNTFSVDPRTSVGVGAVAGTGAVAVENGNGAVHKTTITFTNTPVTLADNAGTVAYGSQKVYDFPDGNIFILGAVADLDLTKSSAGVNADWDGDIGVGTAAADNTNSLSSTEQNIIPTTATPQAVAGATTGNCRSTAAVVADGTGTAADAFLNILVDDADHDVTGTACNIIVNGTLTLVWANLGDY